MNAFIRRGLAAIGLIVLAASLSACIIESERRPPPGPGWCYWHPYACR